MLSCSRQHQKVADNCMINSSLVLKSIYFAFLSLFGNKQSLFALLVRLSTSHPSNLQEFLLPICPDFWAHLARCVYELSATVFTLCRSNGTPFPAQGWMCFLVSLWHICFQTTWPGYATRSLWLDICDSATVSLPHSRPDFILKHFPLTEIAVWDKLENLMARRNSRSQLGCALD